MKIQGKKYFSILVLIKNLLEKESSFMEIIDKVKLFLKSFLKC